MADLVPVTNESINILSPSLMGYDSIDVHSSQDKENVKLQSTSSFKENYSNFKELD